MNAWKISNLGEERHQRETSSFSSSLLDAIYRSIDECSLEDTKSKRHKNFVLENGETLCRAITLDKWLDTKYITRQSRPYNPTLSSSGSSTFSEPEGSKLKLNKMQEREKLRSEFMARTKSKAMKIYCDLKKQPVSPGRRLTKFLNSFFISKNEKRETDLNGSFRKSRSVKDTTVTSSSIKPSKRSVRFYPVTVNIAENNIFAKKYEDGQGLMRTTFERKLVENKMLLNELKSKIALEDNKNGNDEDDMSCSSSDLFEIENIGVGRSVYKEELPVFGTTSLRTNHATANRRLI